MNKLKYAMAMIVAGGAAGVASSAAADVTIETFNFAGPTDGTSFSHDITLAGALAPQFNYSGGPQGIPGYYYSVKHHLDAFGTARLNPTAFNTFSLPDQAEFFPDTTVKTYDSGPGLPGIGPLSAGDTYYHLTFDSGATNYLGTATITGDHTLTQIAYVPSGGVPEPESWALMILGAGVAGAAIRRARREQRQLVSAR